LTYNFDKFISKKEKIMGYSGLCHVNGSDNAADLMCNLISAVSKILSKELSREDRKNRFNTDPVVNVALIIELIGNIFNEFYVKSFTDLIEKTITKLEDYVKEQNECKWENMENRKFHIDSFERMLESLRKMI